MRTSFAPLQQNKTKSRREDQEKHHQHQFLTLRRKTRSTSTAKHLQSQSVSNPQHTRRGCEVCGTETKRASLYTDEELSKRHATNGNITKRLPFLPHIHASWDKQALTAHKKRRSLPISDEHQGTGGVSSFDLKCRHPTCLQRVLNCALNRCPPLGLPNQVVKCLQSEAVFTQVSDVRGKKNKLSHG